MNVTSEFHPRSFIVASPVLSTVTACDTRSQSHHFTWPWLEQPGLNHKNLPEKILMSPGDVQKHCAQKQIYHMCNAYALIKTRQLIKEETRTQENTQENQLSQNNRHISNFLESKTSSGPSFIRATACTPTQPRDANATNKMSPRTGTEYRNMGSIKHGTNSGTHTAV